MEVMIAGKDAPEPRCGVMGRVRFLSHPAAPCLLKYEGEGGMISTSDMFSVFFLIGCVLLTIAPPQIQHTVSE